jgi:hypothetical protein
MVADLTTRPWLLVLDADGVLSSNERIVSEALLRAEIEVKHRSSQRAFPRQLYTFVTVEASGNKNASLHELSCFLATKNDDPGDALSFVRDHMTHLRLAQKLDVLVPLGEWVGLSPGDSPAVGQYKRGAEPYFAARPPIPYFSEAYRGRGLDKSGWYWELFHGAEFGGNVIAGHYIFMDTSQDSWRDESGTIKARVDWGDATGHHFPYFAQALRLRNCSLTEPT